MDSISIDKCLKDKDVYQAPVVDVVELIPSWIICGNESVTPSDQPEEW